MVVPSSGTASAHCSPAPESVPFGSISALRQELQKGDVAAFIVEPIQGKGVYMAPPEYWREAQELCRQHKTLLVLDEVQTGLGRTGKFFCFEHWDLKPDIITVSKALSGGYHPARSDAHLGPRLLVGVQLAREGAQALDHVRPEPVGHGGRPGHSGHLRRRGHRRAGPSDRTGLRSGPGPAGRALRDVPRGPGEGTDDRTAVRSSAVESTTPAVQRRSSTCVPPSSPR